MPLSRLDNFLKNARGNILYVNPNDLDATDSIENQGNSLTRPFKTIQRALIEASRFSYQRGLDNDRFGQTTILLYPGDHLVDNRPGWIPDGSNNYKLRGGTTSSDYGAWDLTTNFDLTTENNALYKLNSVYGGVVVPRGTSIVGLDLRKTKIRPKYVPNPENDNIERSALFRLTGACYLWQFTVLDADPNGVVYKDYTTNTFVPNFSHHKLTVFEYADGVNDVVIDDAFISNFDAGRTDLDMYYEKVGLAYGPSSGREIEPDYPSSSLDIQPKIDEYRIVGPTGGTVGISSIFAGDSSTSTTTITVQLTTGLEGLDVDTAFEVDGVSATGYDGQFVVSDVLTTTDGLTERFQYKVQNAPTVAAPSATGSTVNLNVDTVSSASPYIFNISMRSVFGMCGLHADGDKATGFKSMVVAQFTGIGLQKDNSAFVKYDVSSGTYKDSTAPTNENIHTDSRAIFKPTYANYHIKASNNAFLQLVSIFAIGYAEHFTAESGGDHSVTNSNSNFGAKALVASGFRKDAFPRDDVGYVTHVIPPREITSTETGIEFGSIDVAATVGIASTNRLYLYNETNEDVPPNNVIEGFRIGAKVNDTLNVLIPQGGVTNQYSARIIVPNTQFTNDEVSSEKKFFVGRSSGINSISSNIVTFVEPHTFINGESIRFISEDGRLPDGLENNRIYYAITDAVGLSTDQIKIAQTLNDAINDNELTVNNKGGTLKVLSRVSDKSSGAIGHPIQWDSTQSQWYINVATAATENTIYSTIISLGTTTLGSATPRTFINRRTDTRNLSDTIYKLRYVIPAGSGITSARPPIDGFVIQESNTTTGASDTEVDYYFNPDPVTLSNVNELRNFKFIANASWDGTYAYFTTELPHKLSVGSLVEVLNVQSTNNTTGIASVGFNNTYEVVGISSSKLFQVALSDDPGTFDLSQTVNRTTSLPRFARKNYDGTYYVYRSQEIQKYVSGEQDGIYHLIILNSSNSPTVYPFQGQRFSQPVKDLYPQTDRDNPSSDPVASVSFALPDPIGQVVIDDPKHSVTKETIDKDLLDTSIGIGVTDIVSNAAGTAHTIYTSIDHGLNRIINVSIANSGAGYGYGVAQSLYNARLVGFAGSTTGANATARIDVDAAGGITGVKIMDGGSAYGIGNTLAVVGVGTTTGFSQAVLTVTDIYNNVGDVYRVSGVSSDNYVSYNNLYRVTGVEVGSSNEVEVESASTISFPSTTGVGVTLTSGSFAYLTGRSLNVTSLTYDNVSGLATVVTAQNHGFRVDNKIKLSGATSDLYNGDFIVERVTPSSLTSFVINIGVSTTSPATTGTIYAYPNGFVSNDGVVSIENENIGGRQVAAYAGITTTLFAAISSPTTTSISISNPGSLDIQLGDYLLIDDEIVRVSAYTGVSTNPFTVFRGVLGTRRTTHVSGSVVKRISPTPIELRRNSIIRASGHTFEYVGFGPGNYSTALPERQDRQLSAQEEFLAQSTKYDGGINVYTGMNNDGDFYIGNKKVSSATGQEEVFDAPIPTVTGEDIAPTGVSVGFDVLSPLEVTISRSLRVEGGSDNNIISEFDGPVIFNNKITSTSSKGVEANSIFLQGDATVSRKYTVGISTPILSGNPGDLTYNANPTKGGYLGWVYTTENDWYRFGNVSLSKTQNIQLFDSVGIGTTNPQYNLHVVGSANVSGTLTATTFVGDGSGLTNLANDSLWATVASGLGTGIYPINLLNVGIGTTVPRYNLELGSPGVANTDLYVNNTAVFAGFTTTRDVLVGGMLTSTSFRLDGATSNIRAGIITATTLESTTLRVGTAYTTLMTSGVNVGIGTSAPRAKFDVEGAAKFKTYSENVETLDISSGVVIVDLAKAQTFNLTVDEAITQFNVVNPPSGATAFTIKITQSSTAYAVGIDTFRAADGATVIPVYWPGGVLPIVTPVANKTDIYSFMTFDGASSLYGVIGGQNFS